MPRLVLANLAASVENIDKYSLVNDWRKTLSSPRRRPLSPPSSGNRSQNLGAPLKQKRASTSQISPRRSRRLKSKKDMEIDGGAESEDSGLQWDTKDEAELGVRLGDETQVAGRRAQSRGDAVRRGGVMKRGSRSRSSEKRGLLLGLGRARGQRLWDSQDFEGASTFDPPQSEVTTSSRSRSPVKSVVDLLAAKPSTVFIPAAPGTQFPESVTQLRRLLTKGTYCNEGIIPRGLESTVKSYLGQLVDQLSEGAFGSDDLSTEDEQKLWKKVQKLSKAAQDCEGKSEETWSDSFVFKIFEFAIKQCGLTNHIGIVNVKTTPPMTELLPRDVGLAALPLQRKQIDYIFALKPSLACSVRIGHVLRLEPDGRKRGINQIADVVLAKLPIFALVEMKKLYQTTDPLVQLGIWAAAGFERWRLLTELMGESEALMQKQRPLPLPMWTTQGGCWSLYIAYSPCDERVEVYGPVMIKHAGDLVDVFALVETNMRIMRWGLEVFAPWFEMAVLDSILAAS